MAFIDKIDPVVLNVKITSKGREALSKGNLRFKYFAIGDSEIDYEFMRNARNIDESFNPFSSKILRPADKNPNLISFITKNLLTQTDLLDEFTDDNQYNVIDEVPSIAWEVENTAESIGFFVKNGNNFEFKVTEEYIKQPDLIVNYNTIENDDINKTYQLVLKQSDDYGANKNNPDDGDFLLIRWKDEDADFDTTGYTINREKATPILIYKIVHVDGNILDGEVKVWVDRKLPKFTSDINVGAMILYSNTSENLEQQYNTDYTSEALISFLQNCQCDTIVFPFWKLSIIHTENVGGSTLENKQFIQHKSASFAGFVNYIQNHQKIYDRLGVIHYTNVSPANTYAEQFLRRTPTIHLPTIMWHKSTDMTVGLTLRAVGDLKTLVSGNMFVPSLNTKYYDLADDDGNVVGKVFVELKIFVIEDQELLFAMSYKSNRSWTLPNFSVGANDSIYTECKLCEGNIDFSYTKTNVTAFGGNDGTITITGITGLINDDEFNVLIKVSGNTGFVYSEIHDDESFLNGDGIIITGLTAGTYEITVIDLGAPYTDACKKTHSNIKIETTLSIEFRAPE